MANDHAKDGQDGDEKVVKDVDDELKKDSNWHQNVNGLKYDF